MPADLSTRTLFMLPERLSDAQFYASLTGFTLGNWDPYPIIIPPWTPTPLTVEYDPIHPSITLDLRFLYLIVLSLGGYEAIETTSRWEFVAERMQVIVMDPYFVRDTYKKYLYLYEVYSRKVRRLFAARKRKDRDPKDYPPHAISPGQSENDIEDFYVSCTPWCSIESSTECEIQGMLDSSIVLNEYFSLSPAIELYLQQQIYIEALRVFTNPGERYIPTTRQKSIDPSSAPSLSEDLDDTGSNDEHLSAETRIYKEVLLKANRSYIVESQIYNTPEPLPEITPSDLAPFIYDEVDVSRPKTRGKQIRSTGSESTLEYIERIKKSKESPSGSQYSEEMVPLSEYFDLDGNIVEVGAQTREELAEKYGLVYKPEPVAKDKEKTLNFQEYLMARGHDAPEVKYFFNERLKMEGGFWGHELRRLEALERRASGKEEPQTKGWEMASVSGSVSSGSSYDSYDTDSPIRPPPGLEEQPISLHQYSRKVAKHVEKPLEWELIAPPQAPKTIERPAFLPRQPSLQSLDIPETPYTPSLSVVKTQGSLNSEFVHQQEEYEKIQFRRDARKKGVQYSFDSGTPYADEDTFAVYTGDGTYTGEQIIPMNELVVYSLAPESEPDYNTRLILSLPSGVRKDITEVNPNHPEWYRNTQRWLQRRASEDTRVLWAKKNNTYLHQRTPSSNLAEEMAEAMKDGSLFSSQKALRERFPSLFGMVDRALAVVQLKKRDNAVKNPTGRKIRRPTKFSEHFSALISCDGSINVDEEDEEERETN